MLRSFPDVEIVLTVGIGSGVLRDGGHDVRLGDVVLALLATARLVACFSRTSA